MGGVPGGSIGDPFNMPMTAHFIGGATIGRSPEDGVVDGYQRVINYPGLHIADGSAISAGISVIGMSLVCPGRTTISSALSWRASPSSATSCSMPKRANW